MQMQPERQFKGGFLGNTNPGQTYLRKRASPLGLAGNTDGCLRLAQCLENTTS